MKNLVTVIVPVYNVEKYLERCIRSLIFQNYTALEIILIDDGSTDKSGEICDLFAKRDPRISVIHQNNKGLSAARNRALDVMKGDWVTFVDSDDWVTKDYISYLFELNIKNEGDIAVGSYINAYEGTANNLSEKKVKIEVLDNEKAVSFLLYQKKYSTSAWGKLYKSELFSEIRFPEGKLYEDVMTIYQVFAKTKKVICSDKKLYFYFQRQQSIIRSNYDIRKMDYVEQTKTVVEHVKKEYPQLLSAAISRLLWSEIHVLVHMDDRRKHQEEYIKLWEDIRKNRKNVLCDSQVRWKNKIVILLTYFGNNVLKKVYEVSVR